MMHCFVCHPNQLEPLDALGKHKRQVSYNKNQGISALKKHACHEHPYLYKNENCFCCKELQKPKVKNRG